MKRILPLFGILCFCALTSCAQTSSWPSALLWRISGNGLTKDSYLFGSMHLQDKRVFQLSDSLYYYLGKAEGFAMEVDAREFMDSILQAAVVDQMNDDDDDKRAGIPDVEIKGPPPAFEELSKRDLKKLKKLRREKIASLLKNERMPVILDVYLYGVSSRLGKWVGGVEDVGDQLEILDELGKEVKKRELDLSSTVTRGHLEKMISIYTAHDLNGILTFINAEGKKDAEDLRFITRNYKMARRMDSLSNIRSMFYTVGAAHLPGEEGVITLLRAKGYTVEPVFSKKITDPDEYRRKLPAPRWQSIIHQSGTFKVDMPAEASDLMLFDGVIATKVGIDMIDQEFFMAAGIVSEHADAAKEIDAIVRRMKGKLTDVKKIEHASMPGIEATMRMSGFYYRVRYLADKSSIYMLMSGADKESILKSDNTRRFFQSLTVVADPVLAQRQSVVQTETDKFFSIKWPGQYKRKTQAGSKSDGQTVSVTAWDYLDLQRGQYYLVQVMDVKPGLLLDSDSLFFNKQIEGYRERAKKLENEFGIKDGFSYYLANAWTEDDMKMRSFTLIRGNRIYLVLAGVSAKMETKEDSLFVSSFKLLDYPEPVWKEELSPDGDFKVKLPSALHRMDAGENVLGQPLQDIIFTGANPADAVSYRFEKQSIGDYTEVTDTLEFLKSALEKYELDEDSVMEKREVKNGNAPGLECVMSKAHSHNVKQVRVLLYGDTLYTIMVVQLEEYARTKRYQPVFESFSFTRPYDNTRSRENKTAKLLNDLLSTDSLTFSKARFAVYGHNFTKKDLLKLREMIVQDIPGDSLYAFYYRVRFQLAGKLNGIGDDATVDFLAGKYRETSPARNDLQEDILQGLASIQTNYSYQALLKLLLDKTPSADSTGTFDLSYTLYDSLELTRKLYPELLQLLSKPHIALSVIDITDRLVKDGYLEIKQVQPYLPQLLTQADSYLQQGWSEADVNGEGYRFGDMLHLLGYFPDTAVAARIRGYLSPGMPYALQEGVYALLRMKEKVPAVALNDLAANPLYRLSLFTMLDTLGHLSLFPSKFRNQRAFAEAELLSYLDNDDWRPHAEFIKDKKIKWQGKDCRIFLFKLTDDGMEPVLGVAGPYTPDQSDLKTQGELTGYSGETYKPREVDKLLEKYLETMEEGLR